MSQIYRSRLPIFLISLAASQLAATLAAMAEEPENIFFHEHYNAAIREAKLTKKPIFLEFRCAP